MLPLPVVAFVQDDRRSRLRGVWQKVKHQIGTGSDRISDSLGDLTNENTSDAGSMGGRRASSFMDGVGAKDGKLDDEDEQDEGVDRVVIDRTELPHLWKRGEDYTSPDLPDPTHSDGTGTKRQGVLGGSMSDRGSSILDPDPTWFEPMSVVSNFCKCRLWPLLLNFFYPRYPQTETEAAFQKELWITQKSTYLCASLFLIFNIILTIGLLPRPWSMWNKVAYYLLGPIFAVPLVVMTIFDFPRKRPLIWQCVLFFSIWITASGYIIDMRLCGYYSSIKNCGNRDFMATFYYATAFPILSLFALGQQRLFALAGILVFIGLTAGMVVPVHVTFVRNLVNWMVFQAFVLFFHYMREQNDRRLFTLRAELKVQFRAKQRAQIKERKTMAAGRRFSNYLFHEVRVPLNTALLAVQNLKAESVFEKDPEHEIEYSALDGSLRIMSQVLNDVLDFSRMSRGGFSSVSRPFSFHRVMRSIVGPLKLVANARGLELVTSFDQRIDEVALKAAAGAEETTDIVAEGSGLVIGDELRLRQIINNLTTNAAKFTNPGGRVTVTTKLVYPGPVSPLSSPSYPAETPDGSYLSDSTLFNHRLAEEQQGSDVMEVVIVRIEVTDTGAGIRARDMKDDKLFSAYVQTEIGRSQGGKGTGLGLSLVRQIVSLSGGRLGVKSRTGVGSCFWVELPFNVGPKTREIGDIDFAGVRERIEKDLATPNSYAEESEYGFDLPHQRPTPSLSATGEAEEFAEAFEMSQMNMSAVSIPRLPKPFVFELEIPPGRSSPPPDLTPKSTPPPSALRSLSPSTPHLSSPSALSAHSSSSLGNVPKPSPLITGSSQRIHFHQGPLSVLVVDDDSLTRKLMSRMLGRVGCEVSSAENGAVALEMLLAPTEHPSGVAFDIIFLDNQMPVMSGLAVVSKLRELGRTEYVVGVTANAQLQDQEEYIAKGAQVVLTKPVKEADLRQLLVVADGMREARTATNLAQLEAVGELREDNRKK